MKFLQLSFVIFVGEELAEFVREECEKNLKTTALKCHKWSPAPIPLACWELHSLY